MSELAPGVTVVIPTIPPRKHLLMRALRSVEAQTRRPDKVIVRTDWRHRGAGPTRTSGLRCVETEWVTFLDDDDEWYPQHLQRLMETAEETGADLVYPWFDVVTPEGPGEDPFPQFFGLPWDPDQPHLFPVCALVRTKYAQQSEFPPLPAPVIGPHGEPENPGWSGDDWPFWLGVFATGCKVVHLPERTWAYHHWGIGSQENNGRGNTSGRPDRW